MQIGRFTIGGLAAWNAEEIAACFPVPSAEVAGRLVAPTSRHGGSAVRIAKHRLAGSRLRVVAVVGEGDRAHQVAACSVGDAPARQILPEALTVLEQAAERGLNVGELVAKTRGWLAGACRDTYAAYVRPRMDWTM